MSHLFANKQYHSFQDKQKRLVTSLSEKFEKLQFLPSEPRPNLKRHREQNEVENQTVLRLRQELAALRHENENRKISEMRLARQEKNSRDAKKQALKHEKEAWRILAESQKNEKEALRILAETQAKLKKKQKKLKKIKKLQKTTAVTEEVSTNLNVNDELITTAFTAPVSFQTFISVMFAKIVTNLATPCVQILRALHQEVIVRCPKGVGIALEAKLNQYVLANAHFFNGIFRVNPESETFPDFFSNFKSADGQHVITDVDLKCCKNGCFDLSRLELLFEDMAKPGGVYKKLFKTMYIITFYCFDENTGQVKPEPSVLKYIHELTARSGKTTCEMMTIGGTSVNLRPTRCTIKTYKDIGAYRTRADFIEIVLETLFSEHERCQYIRKKISIKEKGKQIDECRWEWHTSIATQVLDLQESGLFVRPIRDSFETNGIEHKTGLNHNK